MTNAGRLKAKKFCKACGKPLKNRGRMFCSPECRYGDCELLGFAASRQRVFSEQNFACNGCGISEWQGKPIGLQLEHKDGNRDNNVRSNLEGLCPNCHSQTSTWCGRNKTRRLSDEELIAAIRNTSSIRKALVSLNMAPKGNNYERIKRLAISLEEKVGHIGVEPMHE